MASCTRFLIYAGFILFLITGCSGKGNPSVPDTVVESGDQVLTPELTAGREVSEYKGSHFPLFHNLVYMNVTDPENVEYEIVPLREGFMHLNILKFLEVSPCTDCFEITNVTWPEPGRIDVDFKITHPYDDPLYTIFDVRGIMMFDGSCTFGSLAGSIPDPSAGDGALLNAEGYTSFYNTWAIGLPAPEIQEYFQGKYATDALPNAIENGYIRHISDDPANTRNALYAGDSVTRTYSLKYPENEFVFGYSVDANWAPPLEIPVDDPMTDFGPEANSSEPWKITVVKFDEGLTDMGGSTWLQIDVYDWGGKETHELPAVECPKLKHGLTFSEFILETDDYARYHVPITNEKLALGGTYKVLISVLDNDYNPDFPWLDMSAYQVVDVTVKGFPVAIAGVDPTVADPNEPVQFWSYDSYDPDGGEIVLHEWDWDNDGIYDETGSEVVHMFEAIGLYKIQCRVTDDEGQTDELDEPLTVGISGSGFPITPEEIPHNWLSFKPVGVEMAGNLAYITAWPPCLIIYDLSNPVSPVLLGSVDLPGVSDVIAVDDGYAYVGFGDPDPKCIAIIDIDPPGQSAFVNDISVNMRLEEIKARDGFVYAGFQNTLDYNAYWTQLKIIDVNPPEDAHIFIEFPLPKISYYNSWPYGILWDYGLVPGFAFIGNYVYASNPHSWTNNFMMHKIYFDPPESGMIEAKFDLNCYQLGTYQNYLFIPDSYILGIWDPDSEPDGLVKEIIHYTSSNATNFWIDPLGIAGVSFASNKCIIFDIDPVMETYIASEFDLACNSIDGDNGLACAVHHDSISILDTDPPESTYIASQFEFPGECHSLEISGGYAYMATPDGITILDIDPLTDAHKVKELTIFEDKVFSLVVDDNLLYAQEDKWSGGNMLYIFDISNPVSPSVIKNFLITDHTSDADMVVNDGYLYINGLYSHLEIIDVDPVASAHTVNTVQVTLRGGGIEVANGYAYLTPGGGEINNIMAIVDIDPPETAHEVAVIPHYNPNGSLSHSRIAIHDNLAYITARELDWPSSESLLLIFDISVQEGAELAKTIYLPKHHAYHYPHPLEVSGDYIYITTENQILIVDCSSIENATVLNSTTTMCKPWDLVKIDDTLYVGTECGIELYDLW